MVKLEEKIEVKHYSILSHEYFASQCPMCQSTDITQRSSYVRTLQDLGSSFEKNRRFDGGLLRM